MSTHNWVRQPQHYPPMGLPGLYSANHYTRPHFEVEEGEGAAGAEGLGEGSGDDGGEGEVFEFSGENETKKYKFPGTDKAMTPKEYQAHVAKAYLPRQQYEGTLATMGKIADAIRQAQGGRQPQSQQRQQQQPQRRQSDADAANPLAELEAMDILDGKTAAKVLREFQAGTVSPMTQALLALGNAVKEIKGHVGSTRAREEEGEYLNEVRTAAASLGIPSDVPGADLVQRLIGDFFYAHDDRSRAQLKGKVLQSEFKKHFDQQRTFFRNLEKADLAAAQRRARDQRFVKPGKGTSANGKAPRVRSNAQAAELLFAGSQPEA